MPKQMVTLNDFSGGINTKASPRDIKPNELQETLDCIVSIPGVVKTSKSITDKDAGTNTLVKTAKGNGFILIYKMILAEQVVLHQIMNLQYKY